MHRVDPKKRRGTILRWAAYFLTLVLTITTTVVLLYFALGYRLDSKSGQVVRSGLLLVDADPQAAVVELNSVVEDEATPSRFVLSAGDYNLKLRRAGYHDWSKRVSIAASGVREVTYPRLVPTNLQPKKLLEHNAVTVASQSLDRKRLLLYIPSQSRLQLVNLNPEKSEETSLPLPGSVKRENGSLGHIRVIEWALDNKHVLLEQILPSGRVELLSLDVTKPNELVNISTLYGATTPTVIHYVGREVNMIYGLKDGRLSRYNLEQNQAETVLQNVRSYQPYGDDTVLYDRQVGATNEVGIWKDTVTTVVQTGNSQSPALLKYASYDDHFYLAVSYPVANVVTIYRDPLKKPVVAKHSPFITLQFDAPQKLEFSESSQFLLMQNGKTFLTYDFEDLKQYKVTLPFEVSSATALSWLDSHHLQAKRSDGVTVMMDYDGLNQQALVASSATSRLYFANDYESVYRLLDANGRTQLDAVRLLVED